MTDDDKTEWGFIVSVWDANLAYKDVSGRWQYGADSLCYPRDLSTFGHDRRDLVVGWWERPIGAPRPD